MLRARHLDRPTWYVHRSPRTHQLAINLDMLSPLINAGPAALLERPSLACFKHNRTHSVDSHPLLHLSSDLMILSIGSVVGRPAQSTPSQVWYDDIPGSICGPEDGPWPRSFTRLGRSEAWATLAQASDPQSMSYGACGRWSAHAVNFQPFQGTKSQDRYAMRRINIGGRTWTFTAVFDGK